MQKRWRLTVCDGLDCAGKGVFLDALAEEARRSGKRIFDVHQFWAEHNFHPSPYDIIGNYDVILTSEPTFVGIGKYIRNEIIAKNGRDYHPVVHAEAYALDRRILYQQLLLPVLAAGVDVYQSRSFSTSVVYQLQTALDQGLDCDIDQIMNIPGNSFCASYPVDFLVVPKIDDVEEAMRRLVGRDKDDRCEFETFDFQTKLRMHYHGEPFKALFERLGVALIYMDASKDVEFSQQQAKDFFHQRLE